MAAIHWGNLHYLNTGIRLKWSCVPPVTVLRNMAVRLKVCVRMHKTLKRNTPCNRQFPEITGKDNFTVFSYSGRVKSPEWRWQLRRANLRQLYIFRHGPIIIYTRLPAGGTYYLICMFPTNSERLIGISDAFSAFVYGYPSSCPCVQCTPNKSGTTLRYTRRHGPVYIQANTPPPSLLPFQQKRNFTLSN